VRRAGIVFGAIVLGLLLSLASLVLTGCGSIRLVRIDGAGPIEGDPNTIIMPEGGSLAIAPDGTWLTVYDAAGFVVWEGDPR